MSEQIKYMTIRELAEKIRAHELTCLAVATEFLSVISKKADLNAIIYCSPANVLHEAALLDAEAENNRFRGALHGVPIMLKDNIHMAGVANTAGTAALKNFVPVEDAACVSILRRAGCILIAKNNLHELASGVTTDNYTFGRCENPHDADYSAGGSSGGTGCAVAAHMAPAGLATDTAGSIRIPASVNGVCGFRPSTGRYANEGVTPISRVRDTVGSLATTVDDLILLDEVLTGGCCLKTEFGLQSLDKVRLGVSRDALCGELDDEVRRAFNRALECLQGAGVELVDVDFGEVKRLTDDCSSLINFYGARVDIDKFDFLILFIISVTGDFDGYLSYDGNHDGS
jgi:mandelamide amidase